MVNVATFCGFIEVLQRRWGDRLFGPGNVQSVNEMILLAGQVERVWLALPPAPPGLAPAEVAPAASPPPDGSAPSGENNVAR